MGNRRSRAAARAAGGSSFGRVREQRELTRQLQAARVLGLPPGRPAPSAARLRLYGLAMFAVAALLGAGASLLVRLVLR